MNSEPFRARVEDTETFVNTCLVELGRQAKRVMEMTRNADMRAVDNASKSPEMGVRYEMASRGDEPVLLEKAAGGRRTGPITDWEAIKMPVFDRFTATRTSKLPQAYLVPSSAVKVVQLLRLHGVKVERLAEPWAGLAETFAISEAVVAPSPFQGHRLVRLEGKFAGANTTVEAGSYLVRTAQPLAALVFDLLEPESLDGVVSWGLFGEDWSNIKAYPIQKVFRPVRVASVEVP